ncbi:ankyrin repeat domain-containing protein, partial [Acinetobacter baumannii]
IAAAAGRTELAELILAAGADSNGRNRAGETALILAAQGGHAPIVKALLAKGADVSVRAATGLTAMAAAVGSFNSETIAELL